MYVFASEQLTCAKLAEMTYKGSCQADHLDGLTLLTNAKGGGRKSKYLVYLEGGHINYPYVIFGDGYTGMGQNPNSSMGCVTFTQNWNNSEHPDCKQLKEMYGDAILSKTTSQNVHQGKFRLESMKGQGVFAVHPIHPVASAKSITNAQTSMVQPATEKTIGGAAQETPKNNNSCPTSIEFYYPLRTSIYSIQTPGSVTLDLPPLKEKVFSRAQLEENLKLLKACADTSNGAFVNPPTWSNPSILGENRRVPSSNEIWCYGPSSRAINNSEQSDPRLLDPTFKRLEAYACHQAQGWPSATDSSKPASTQIIESSMEEKVPAPSQKSVQGSDSVSKKRIPQATGCLNFEHKNHELLVSNKCMSDVDYSFCLKAPTGKWPNATTQADRESMTCGANNRGWRNIAHSKSNNYTPNMYRVPSGSLVIEVVACPLSPVRSAPKTEWSGTSLIGYCEAAN